MYIFLRSGNGSGFISNTIIPTTSNNCKLLFCYLLRQRNSIIIYLKHCASKEDTMINVKYILYRCALVSLIYLTQLYICTSVYPLKTTGHWQLLTYLVIMPWLLRLLLLIPLSFHLLTTRYK